MNNNNKTKVLFIAGTGRNGSTILDNILGQLEGFFSGGEIGFLWERGITDNQLCGCGKPHLECEVWSNIYKNIKADRFVDEAERWAAIKVQKTRIRRIIWHIFNGKRETDTDLDQFLNVLESLYHAIAFSVEADVIVDSSKYPLYGELLNLIPSLEVYTVHLVRDPRAMAFSWRNPKDSQDPNAPKRMAYMNLWTSSFVWNVWNLLIEIVNRKRKDKYLFLSYEEFSSNPKMSMEKILHFMHIARDVLPVTEERWVELKINHTVSGNPSRFHHGKIQISEDNRWIYGANLAEKITVTLFTFPLLIRYGYKIFRR